ncbi:energy-coupling factor ABC transporter ATP-binding protein [Arthrobacter sp. AOP36-C1-22]|uniref:energy-coupling factor ABC transporter ATP-binding protein n=1 Tax=Arthrobacter sp. AOP36-C1-22 TaxID=3457683 RepID=UPI0040343B1E
MNSISLDQVGVRLGETTALEGISLNLGARRIAIIGENGSGKSTLARVIGGLVAPSSGSLRVHGVDPVRQKRELRRLVAFVFSNPDAQIIMPTVGEDVAFSLRSEKLSQPEEDARVSGALAAFGLSELAGRSAHELSGGQKQLLALCGAFVRRPDLVIADEPTALLDTRNSRTVADHLFLGGDHQLVLVTHDPRLALRCDTAVLVGSGRIHAVGDPVEVLATYERSLAC